MTKCPNPHKRRYETEAETLFAINWVPTFHSDATTRAKFYYVCTCGYYHRTKQNPNKREKHDPV